MSEDVVARRYRRLLFAYPAAYRAEREEEILGVLLDAAADGGRDKPAVGDMFDLVRAGISTRLRSALVAPSGRAWREAAAVAAVLVAAVLATRAVGYFVSAASYLGTLLRPEAFEGQHHMLLTGFIGAPFTVGWLLVPLALAGRRFRTAAAMAVLATAADIGLFAWLIVSGNGTANGFVTAPNWIAIEVAVATVLIGADRSRHGVDLVGRKRLLGMWGLASVALAVAVEVPGHRDLLVSFVLIGATGIVARYHQWFLGGMVGRRVLAAAAAATVVRSAGHLRSTNEGALTRSGLAVIGGGLVMVLALVASAAWNRWWPAGDDPSVPV